MNILSPQVQEFIRDHERDDERSMVLQRKEILGIPSSIIAEQITGRRKAKEKLPTYYLAPSIIYPPALNLEQTSSEQTATFKKNAVAFSLEGERPVGAIGQGTGADLTGGFGVDTFFLSSLFRKFHYVEPDTKLLEIARNNHIQLGAKNIQYHNTTAEEFLDQFNESLDLVYADPSRRVKENKKVLSLTDSDPDITILQNTIFNKSKYFLLKASPLLDIHRGLQQVSHVKRVFVVAVDNDVKEVLFLGERTVYGEPLIEAINLFHGKSESMQFSLSSEKETLTEFCNPRTFLYEPNAAILKAGAFKSVAKIYGLSKIQPNTHFYTSDNLVMDFPGRIFKIIALVKPDPKSVKQHFVEGKANVITRNYPLSPDDLKKKTKLIDGGEKYLIAFSGTDKKFVVAATRQK